jgi:hypothetical protein
MVDTDQDKLRILIDSIRLDSPEAGFHFNQKKLIVILDRYSWIEQSEIGTKDAEASFYTINIRIRHR